MPNLFGSPPPPPTYNQLVTGNDSEFTSAIGSWTNTGGTQTRDTSYKWGTLNASLKLATTAAGQFTSLPIAGTFKAGVEYVAFVAVSLEVASGLPSPASLTVQFGLNGTDVVTDSTGDVTPASRVYAYGGTSANWVVTGLRWTPSANRTGVTLRVTRPNANGSNTQNWHVGWVKVFRVPVVGGPATIVAPGTSNVQIFSAFKALSNLDQKVVATALDRGFYQFNTGIGFGDSYGGIDFGDYGAYMSAEGPISPAGDLNSGGLDIEVGEDYVGLYISEKDSTTVQMYADTSAGYMMQLRNRGANRGWSISENGTINRRIESYFEEKLFISGALTTGTDKGGVSQVIELPFKSRVDEVRIHAGTAPTGANLLVDVNAGGTTIFTTQDNRPALGINVKNLTSGGSSTDAAGYGTASVSFKAGQLYLVSVENSHASAAPAIDGIGPSNGLSAGAITFTSRSTTTFNGGLNRTSIWSGVATRDFTDFLNIDWLTTQTGATWSVDEVTGVNTTTNDGVVQQVVGTGSSTTPLATLAAFGAAENGAYAAHGHAAATATTPGTGWTELADTTTATPAQAIETAWRMDNDTTADATIASAAWGSCAIELLASKSANSRTPDGGTSIPKDTPITVDIDQIGSGTAGSDLTVWIRGTAIW